MIFSYSGASLQNSLSPGTKRHTKDSVRPLHVKHSLAWETHSRVAGVQGAGAGSLLGCPSSISHIHLCAHLSRCLLQCPLSLPVLDHPCKIPLREGNSRLPEEELG